MTADALHIRPFQDRDEAAVAALWRVVFPNNPAWNVPEADIRRKLSLQREFFIVAECGGSIVGTVMAGDDGHRGWVHLVAVHPDYRRKGVGRALMERAEQLLRDNGCPKLNLQVRGGNEAVVAFYERLGYQVEDRVSLGKRLTGG